MADRGMWRGWAGFAVLAIASATMLALNFGGRTPLRDAALSVFKPLIAIAGAADKPGIGGEAPADPELPLLRAKNARLSHEISRLRETLEAVSKTRFDGKRYAFRGVPAQVLARMGDANSRRMLIVDRGTADGVVPGMGVVAGDRAIGVVHRASDELSLVMLLTDPGCRVRCTVLPSESPVNDPACPEIECMCEGVSQAENWIALLHVPFHAKVGPGLDVVTSGRGGAFPAGVYVGTIEKAEQGFGMFQDVCVIPAGAGETIGSVMVLVPCLPAGKQPGQGDNSVVRAGN